MSTEHAWKVLAEVNGWIRFADAKAAALLSLSGLLGGWMLVLASGEPRSPLKGAGLLTGMVLVLAAAGLSLSALRPVTGRRVGHSLLHFDDVARGYAGDGTEYARACQALLADPERLVGQVCDQIWINSGIAARKFRDVDRALFTLVPALGVAMGMLVPRVL